MRENLLLVARDFVRRSRTYSQAEDFFTEILAALLRLSPDFRKEFLALVLEDSTHAATELPVWEISTQEEAAADEVSYGVPDLVMKGADSSEVLSSHLIAVEVKLDAVLSSGQLTRYDTWLSEEHRHFEFVSLSALTTSERAYTAAHEARAELKHWSSWIRWAQVEQILSSLLERASTTGDETESGLEDELLFCVYGEAFASLLADEGLVPPSPLRPSLDASLLQEGTSSELESRQINLAHLLHQALRDSGVIEILTDREPSWEPMRARDGLPHRTQHHKGVQLRQRFQPERYRGVFFSFGLVYHARGWLLNDRESPHNLECLGLAAALEVWDDRGSKEANQLSWVLSGDNRTVRPVDTLCVELNAAMRGAGQVFVPETKFKWAKLVNRQSTADLKDSTKESQVQAIGGFFRSFLDAFDAAGGEALGYPDMSALCAVERALKSSSL